MRCARIAGPRSSAAPRRWRSEIVRRSPRSIAARAPGVALLTLVLLFGLWWWSQGSTGSPATDPEGWIDETSGLQWVQLDDLPSEAVEVVLRIESGKPFADTEHDGVVFFNREGLLPDHRVGYYHEYTVPTPGLDTRGARRIVTGDVGELYWTADHYQSFKRILR